MEHIVNEPGPADVLLPAVPSVRLAEGSQMGHVHHEYHIDAPPQAVWALGRDPNRMPEWNTTTVSVKDVTGPLDRPGATYTTVSKIVGHRAHTCVTRSPRMGQPMVCIAP